MHPVHFAESVHLAPRLAGLSQALDRSVTNPVPGTLQALAVAVAASARAGEPVAKEPLLDLAALLLEEADLRWRCGLEADALMLEGLESCLLEALVDGAEDGSDLEDDGADLTRRRGRPS